MSHVDGVDDGIGYGVSGSSGSSKGVRGQSHFGSGVYGESYANFGVFGVSTGGFYAVYGVGNSYGVVGSARRGVGTIGFGHLIGVFGRSEMGPGMHGLSTSGPGVYGKCDHYIGVHGSSISGAGTSGVSITGIGVRAYSMQGIGIDAWGYPGVYGSSDYGPGVVGSSNSGDGVIGRSFKGVGVHGYSQTGYAAFLDGNVKITGNLEKAGGSFKIDHPLDPANKYLLHSFVESPDMKNVYDGIAVLDDRGEAMIELPDWFDSLNKDFRYQLTAIGAPAPNLYIANEISDASTNYTKSSRNNCKSCFKIAGGTPGMKVSWQITGIRKDPWANNHRILVEEDKPNRERGYYMYPDLYGQPIDKGIRCISFIEEEQILINEKNRSPRNMIP